MKPHAIIVLAVLVICAGLAFSQIPPYINYQGVLTGPDGQAMPDGAYGMHFRLYDGPEATEPIWQMAEPIDVVKGIFNVNLGPLDIPFDRQYWLSISIEEQGQLEPRIPLVSSPYAMNARTVADNAITSVKIADGYVVRTLNGLADHVSLIPGANVSITPSDNNLVISATGGGGGVSGGGAIGQVAFWDSPASITGDNMLFWDSANRRLGIGTTGPNARLRVESDEEITGVFASTRQTTPTEVLRANYLGGVEIDAVAVKGISLPADGHGIGGDFSGGHYGVKTKGEGGANHNGNIYGIYSDCTGASTFYDFHYGLWSQSSGSTTGNNIAIVGEATGDGSSVMGTVGAGIGDNKFVYGVYGTAEGSGTHARYGVFGYCPYSTDSTYAGYFSGNLVYTGSFYHLSDRMFKENLRRLDGALDKVLSLEPKRYSYTKDNAGARVPLPRGEHYGLVAQEVEEVLPELVGDLVHPGRPAIRPEDPPEEPIGYKGINYVELIPILIQAIKEQQETIADNRRTIDELRAEVESLKKR